MPYPPPPGPRIAYDTNGSIVLFRDRSGVVQDCNKTAIGYMNSERNYAGWLGRVWQGSDYTDQVSGPNQWLTFVFPVPMRLYAVFALFGYSSSYPDNFPVVLSTSPDTTNGDDGVWTSAGTVPGATKVTGSAVTSRNLITGEPGGSNVIYQINDQYRRQDQATGYMPISGTPSRHVRGLKWDLSSAGNTNTLTFVLHIYGEPDTDSSDSILVFYDDDEDSMAPGDLLDWGDVPQGSSATKAFRLMNNSAAQTAYSVVINAQMGVATADPVPSDSFLFSLNQTSWNTSVTLAALSPGSASGLIYVRRSTPLNAQPSNWAPKVVATVGSWS